MNEDLNVRSYDKRDQVMPLNYKTLGVIGLIHFHLLTVSYSFDLDN